jgi:hypothetical protein
MELSCPAMLYTLHEFFQQQSDWTTLQLICFQLIVFGWKGGYTMVKAAFPGSQTASNNTPVITQYRNYNIHIVNHMIYHYFFHQILHHEWFAHWYDPLPPTAYTPGGNTTTNTSSTNPVKPVDTVWKLQMTQIWQSLKPMFFDLPLQYNDQYPQTQSRSTIKGHQFDPKQLLHTFYYFFPSPPTTLPTSSTPLYYPLSTSPHDYRRFDGIDGFIMTEDTKYSIYYLHLLQIQCKPLSACISTLHNPSHTTLYSVQQPYQQAVIDQINQYIDEMLSGVEQIVHTLKLPRFGAPKIRIKEFVLITTESIPNSIVQHYKQVGGKEYEKLIYHKYPFLMTVLDMDTITENISDQLIKKRIQQWLKKST